MDREKGQDVASMSCPNCGNESELVAMPDGGLAQAPCPNCYGDGKPTEERATAAEAPAQLKREKTTVETPTVNQEESS